MQIEPNSYYLETLMRQSLVNNFAMTCNRPKVNTVENAPQEIEPSRQSPCPSNWSDYLHVENDTDNEGAEQTEPLTYVNSDQPTTLQGTSVPQNSSMVSNAIFRLPKSVPKALTKGTGKGKCNINDAMPIVVYGDTTQLWEQMPLLPKARPPYVTWALVKPQRQTQDDAEHN